MKRITKQRRLARRISELSAGGLRQSDIMRVLKISRPTAHKYLLAAGLPTRKQKMVSSAEAYQTTLTFLDGIFPDGLPFAAEYDSITAAVIFDALRLRQPDCFARASKTDLEQIQQIISSSVHLKRLCASDAQEMVH